VQMDSGSGSLALAFVAILVAAISLALASAAFRRAGRRERVDRRVQRASPGEGSVARSLREGLETSLARVKRAQLRLAEVGERVSEHHHRSVDDLSRHLDRLRRETEHELAQRLSDAPTSALATPEGLGRRIRHIEANIEVLRARSEIATAEELAEGGAFLEAQELLEDALARIREVKLRLSDVVGDDPAFAPVLDALGEAIHALRSRAEDHKRQLETVLSESDSLLAWLSTSREPREQNLAAVGA